MSATERLSPRLKLGRSTGVGAWKVMSLSEVRDKRAGQRDCHLPQLSAKMRRLGVSVAALSDVRYLGTGGSVGMCVPTNGPAVFKGILKEWPGRRRPTGPYDY